MLGALAAFAERLAGIERAVAEVRDLLGCGAGGKEWYSTTELVRALGVTPHTVQERYCNAGRIECEKEPATGKWRISGCEFRRLVNGGALHPPAG